MLQRRVSLLPQDVTAEEEDAANVVEEASCPIGTVVVPVGLEVVV